MTMGDEVWRLFPELSLHGTKCSVKGRELLVRAVSEFIRFNSKGTTNLLTKAKRPWRKLQFIL